MLPMKVAVIAVLMLSSVVAEAPMRLILRMKGGVKRDASHIAKYYLPAAPTQNYHSHHYQPQHHGLTNAQHLNVLDVKLPQHGGHYVPSYALPSKTYESNAHHFPSHTPQFSHDGHQYVVNSGHGGQFEELTKVLGSHGSSAEGHASFGGISAGGASAGHGGVPSYSYASQSLGHSGASAGDHQSADISSSGYSFVSAPEASKTGPLSFGEASQQQQSGHVQQQQQQQQHQVQQQQPQQAQQQQHQAINTFIGHQFGFVAGGQQQHQQQQGAAQISYQPQAQALTGAAHGSSIGSSIGFGHGASIGSGHGASIGATQSTPVYAIGMKGLGHYATGNTYQQQAPISHSSVSASGHHGGFSLGGLQHGGYILDTSALKGLNFGQMGGKFVLMSKPTALTFGQSYGQSFGHHHSPKYTIPVPSYSSGSLSSSHGGYKSAAPFKPSVFLGATQENVSEYEHGNGYAQEATASYTSGPEYKYLPPTAATSYTSHHLGSGHGQ